MSMLVADRSTVEEIDEALQHLRAIPVGERGPAWCAYVDKILELRKSAGHPHPREQRLLHAAETR